MADIWSVGIWLVDIGRCQGDGFVQTRRYKPFAACQCNPCEEGRNRFQSFSGPGCVITAFLVATECITAIRGVPLRLPGHRSVITPSEIDNEAVP